MAVSVGADADGPLPGRHGSPSLVEEKEMSERLLKTLRKSGDLQAEYIRGHSSDAVRLAGSQDYATKMGRVEIYSVEIESRPEGGLLVRRSA